MANSTPIVDFDSKLNSFLVKRDSKLLLPTPESPISTTGTKNSTKHYESHINTKILLVTTLLMLGM